MNEAASEILRIATDDVLQRVGRNLLIYQRIEMNLKQLEATGRPITIDKTTTQESLAAQVNANHDSVRRNTLGTALKRVIRIGESEADDRATGNTEAILIMQASLVLEDTPDSRTWLAGWNDAVVNARNRLAHCFFDTFDIETIEGCAAACRELDKEHDIALSFLHFARSAVDARQLGHQIQHDFMNSEAFSEHMAHLDALASFAHCLGLEAERLCRDDGWCLFETAVKAVQASKPDLIAELMASGWYKTTRAAADATQAFQWHQEQTSKSSQLLFRWHAN